MNAFEALGNHSPDTQKTGPFSRPVAARPRAIFLAGKNDERNIAFLIQHGRIIDRHDFPRRLMFRHAPFSARRHLIADPNIGKGTPHHHFVIAAPRAIRVEVRFFNFVSSQIFTGGAGAFDRTRGRNMVGGDAIA